MSKLSPTISDPLTISDCNIFSHASNPDRAKWAVQFRKNYQTHDVPLAAFDALMINHLTTLINNLNPPASLPLPTTYDAAADTLATINQRLWKEFCSARAILRDTPNVTLIKSFVKKNKAVLDTWYHQSQTYLSAHPEEFTVTPQFSFYLHLSPQHIIWKPTPSPTPNSNPEFTRIYSTFTLLHNYFHYRLPSPPREH